MESQQFFCRQPLLKINILRRLQRIGDIFDVGLNQSVLDGKTGIAVIS
jgi:hypothetical protein